MAYWMAGFQRDAHPSREIGYWEHVTSVLLEYTAMTRMSSEQLKPLFHVVLAISNGAPEDSVNPQAALLPDGAIEKLRALLSYPVPVFEIRDDASIFDEDPQSSSTAEADGVGRFPYDLERFPKDIPDDLIDELLSDMPEAQADDPPP
jgi:hypothetical protein